MPNTIVTLTPGTLPQGYCFTSLQQYYTDIINLTLAQLPGAYNLFNFGPNLPDPADQDKPWIRTDNYGNMDRIYTFSGVWVSPHPTPPGDNERRIWVGTEPQLWSYDGGDGSDPAAATDTTGSMWAIDAAFNLRFPYGADASTVNPKDSGGSASATVGIPPHTHNITVFTAGQNIPDFTTGNAAVMASAAREGLSTEPMATSSAGDAGTTVATLPPYYGVWFIKRSARKFYTVS